MCLIWHILRSYGFVAEVSFKSSSLVNLRCSRGGFYYKYRCYLENSNEILFSSKTNLNRRSTTQPSSTMFLHQLSLQISRTKIDLSLKRLGGGQLDLSCSFFKNVFSRERMKPWFFVTFNIIIIHIFPENLIGISQIVQKIWRTSPSILTIFISFLNFLTFPSYKETNNASI